MIIKMIKSLKDYLTKPYPNNDRVKEYVKYMHEVARRSRAKYKPSMGVY